MSSNNRNIPEDNNTRKGQGVSGLGQGTQTKGVAGGADNTRGENKPSQEGKSGGAKHGSGNRDRDNITPQDPNANLTTTSRGSDSSDKEFRNNQPNASTNLGQKGNKGTESNTK
ncbi:hypothetical protein [Pontibacter fetidus]|uniref:Uncharacterized protein n=1 Tax=Pontibacter fetidus TaxID=2700082 RepID=A0A6B2HAM3_9BACT|nr:hypothetical protein [Pontibacter fetidus]NDK57400.1 hypothetical protein [Pontibacter fetidus]